jgi:hypothetical protein
VDLDADHSAELLHPKRLVDEGDETGSKKERSGG